MADEITVPEPTQAEEQRRNQQKRAHALTADY
jgi:hypothetical protein